LALIFGQGPAGVTITSKNFEVTIRSRRGHAPASLRERAANGLVSAAGRGAWCLYGEKRMTALASAPRSGYQLRVGAPDALPVSVRLTPQQSVIGLMHQAASGQSLGAPASLLATIRTSLRPQARFAAQSFAARGPTLIPECSAPISPLSAASVAEQAGRLREMPAEKLTGLLQVGYDGGGFPRCWEAAGDEPRRWLNSMADASLDTWTVIEPRWRAAGRLFDRELRRVGIAAVRGGMAALLNSLHPRISYADGMLTFAHPDHRCVTLGRRRLVLMPMIAGRDSVLASFERPGVCCIGYPIRQPGLGAQATSGGALAMILGQLRAAMLQALRQPLTVSDLAADVHCAPTTATYHLHQLAAAGLIIRERRGISVRVSRTIRGDELVDLLSD
jgi:DNA-binding transcriptional ArsR family regulator